MASEAIEKLIAGLNRLPGIGAKSARRIALDMLTWDTDAGACPRRFDGRRQDPGASLFNLF